MPGAAGAARDLRLSCRAGALDVSVRATAIEQIRRELPLTGVPGAPAALLGLAHHAGEAIPVLSLATLLGAAPAAEVDARARVLVAALPVGRVGLAVDAILGLRAAAAGDAEPIDPKALVEAAFAAAGHTATHLPAALRESGRAPAATPARAVTEALLVVEVGGRDHAFRLAALRRVLPHRAAIAPVAGMDPAMLGVVALGPDLLPVLLLSRLLALPEHPPTAAARLLVVAIGGRPAALAVDAVRHVRRVGADALEPAPAMLSRGRGEARIAAICRDGAALLAVLDPDALLDAGTMRDLADAASADPAAPAPSAAPAPRRRFVEFTLAGTRYALPIEAIEGVLRHRGTLAPLPRAPDFVEGALNHRGRVLPVIDQRRRFGDVRPRDPARPILLVRTGAATAGFSVDAVHGVAELDAAALVATPPLAQAIAGALFDRVLPAPHRGGMLLAIDPAVLLAEAEHALLAGAAA